MATIEARDVPSFLRDEAADVEACMRRQHRWLWDASPNVLPIRRAADVVLEDGWPVPRRHGLLPFVAPLLGVLAAHGRVPVVFDGVRRPAGHILGDRSPTVA